MSSSTTKPKRVNLDRSSGGGHNEKEMINLDHLQCNIVQPSSYKINSGDVDDDPDNLRKLDYWKSTLCAVITPFTILGFPTHLIFINSAGDGKSKKILPWFLSIFNFTSQNILYIIPTLITLCIASLLTGYVSYFLGKIFYKLIIRGKISSSLPGGFLNLLRTVPAVIPVLFGWFRGYWIKTFIKSFDDLRPSLQNDIIITDEHGEPVGELPKRGLYGKKRGTRSALFWFYFIIISSHVIHIVSEHTITSTIYTITHIIDFMHQMVLPVYCGFCWVLCSEYELLSYKLEMLQIHDTSPTFDIFNKIRSSFKQISGHVDEINKVFKLIMSWVLFVCIISILIKFIFALFYIFGVAAIKSIFFAGIGLFGFGDFIPGGGDDNGDDSSGEDLMNGTLLNFTTTTTTGMPTTTSKNKILSLDDVEVVLTAPVVRATAGYFISAFLQIWATYFTIIQAIRVNDQAKYLHVLLNDYAAQVAGQMTPELYHAYRTLKFYMHSRNEQPRPALLKLPILGMFPMTFMKSRLQSYTLRS